MSSNIPKNFVFNETSFSVTQKTFFWQKNDEIEMEFKGKNTKLIRLKTIGFFLLTMC